MSGECMAVLGGSPQLPPGGAAAPLHACCAGGMAPVWPPGPPWGGSGGYLGAAQQCALLHCPLQGVREPKSTGGVSAMPSGG